ncbi:MAG TPA: DinB family protein [Actinomycetota bacterium]|nr:DinB family protein [Actinomycetota bacterium]
MATREEAIDTLERGHASIRRLMKQIPPHWVARPGVGGEAWTPKDLLGHLCLWEEKVLEALTAWDTGERAPIDREIYAGSIEAINAAGVRARSRHTLARVVRDWDNVHGELIRAIRTMPDARWERPATSRGRKALGHRIGQLLVGKAPFEHADAHVKDLEAFVAAIPETERRGTGAP